VLTRLADQRLVNANQSDELQKLTSETAQSSENIQKLRNILDVLEQPIHRMDASIAEMHKTMQGDGQNDRYRN